MKAISLNFQIHQPFRLSTFPFFKIGSGVGIFNDELNTSILKEESRLYLKLNQLLLQLIESHPGKFNFNFCISGTALEQFETLAPEVLDSFRVLSRTGCMELVGTTFSNSLAAIVSRGEFTDQVKSHSKKIKDLLGVHPKAFLISKQTYTEVIGDILSSLGFRKFIFEGEKSEMDYGEANQVFQNPFHENGFILCINQSLSEPLNIQIGTSPEQINPSSGDDLIDQILALPETEPLVNLNLNYSFLGKYIPKANQLFELFSRFVNYGIAKNIHFLNFSSSQIEGLKKPNTIPQGFNHSPNPKNSVLKTYLGNYLQQEAFYTLYDLEDQVKSLNNSDINRTWTKLQSSDHFYYMNTDYPVGYFPSPIFSPYPSPVQAFINYMNVLTDFKIQIEKLERQNSLNKSRMVPPFKNSIQASPREPKVQKQLALSSF